MNTGATTTVKSIVAAFELARMRRAMERRRQRVDELFTTTSVVSATPSPAPSTSSGSPMSPTTPSAPMPTTPTPIATATLNSITTTELLQIMPARCSTTAPTPPSTSSAVPSASSAVPDASATSSAASTTTTWKVNLTLASSAARGAGDVHKYAQPLQDDIMAMANKPPATSIHAQVVFDGRHQRRCRSNAGTIIVNFFNCKSEMTAAEKSDQKNGHQHDQMPVQMHQHLNYWLLPRTIKAHQMISWDPGSLKLHYFSFIMQLYLLLQMKLGGTPIWISQPLPGSAHCKLLLDVETISHIFSDSIAVIQIKPQVTMFIPNQNGLGCSSNNRASLAKFCSCPWELAAAPDHMISKNIALDQYTPRAIVLLFYLFQHMIIGEKNLRLQCSNSGDEGFHTSAIAPSQCALDCVSEHIPCQVLRPEIILYLNQGPLFSWQPFLGMYGWACHWTNKGTTTDDVGDVLQNQKFTTCSISQGNVADQNKEIADKEIVVDADKNHVSLKILFADKHVETKEKDKKTTIKDKGQGESSVAFYNGETVHGFHILESQFHRLMIDDP